MVFLSSILDQIARLPPVASIPLLPRRWAAVWQSEKYTKAQQVRGTAKLHTTLTSTKESGTLVAYLYDVGPLGLGKLVSNAPYTFHGRTPGKPFDVDLELFSTAYDVPAGHRLALVVDTVDPLYIEHNPSGAQLTFSSCGHRPVVRVDSAARAVISGCCRAGMGSADCHPLRCRGCGGAPPGSSVPGPAGAARIRVAWNTVRTPPLSA